MENMWQDVRYALRGLRRQPGFAIPVIVVLALGIGANTTMFSVLNAVLLHPSSLRAWRSPARVVTLWETNPQLSAMFAEFVPVRPTTFEQWKHDSHSFETMAAWRDWRAALSGGGKTEPIAAGAATAGLFPLLGVRFAAGRNFSADEMRPGGGDVAIVSDEFLRSHFPSAAKAIGRTVSVNSKPLTIIGALPPGVAFPDRGPAGMEENRPLLWTPLRLDAAHPDATFSLSVYGRLKDGVTFAAARAEMNVVESRIAGARKEQDGTGINIVPLVDGLADSDMRAELFFMQIAVGFVLLIACANAGNLLLTRSVARGKEMAVRAAMGAGGFRLLRQIFTESLILAIGAAGGGLLFTAGATRVLAAFAPPDAAVLRNMSMDGYVLAFTIAAALVTSVLFALAPAWYTRRVAAIGLLNSTSRGNTGDHHRLRGALAVAEIAMSLVLVIGAGLMIRSFATLMQADLGFRIDHLLVMDVALDDERYTSGDRAADFDSRLLESVRGIRGVQHAALTTALPLRSVSESSFEIPGRAKDPKKPPVTRFARVSDEYFTTLGIRVLKGRAFAEQEDAAVVNEAFAAAHFRGEDVLGKTVVFNNELDKPVTYRIVGLVANERQMGPDNEAGSELYLPGNRMKSFLLVARTAGDPAGFSAALRQQVWNIDKNQPIASVHTEQGALEEWLAPRRFYMTVLLGFAAIAILLAAMGLYSVLAYTVTLRTREIGIRVAVGATPGNVSRFILKGGLRLAIMGIGIGLVASFCVTRFMETLIYGVDPFDLATFSAVAGLVLTISVAASYLPALRAARLSPSEALRAD